MALHRILSMDEKEEESTIIDVLSAIASETFLSNLSRGGSRSHDRTANILLRDGKHPSPMQKEREEHIDELVEEIHGDDIRIDTKVYVAQPVPERRSYTARRFSDLMKGLSPP